jgi:Icc-related predicted phosphoesterase
VTVEFVQEPGATSTRLREIRESSSVRVMLVGDIHLADRPPASRVEGYLDDVEAKLLYVAKLAKALNCDATVWAGDVFHFKQPSRTSHATVLRAIQIAQKFENLYVVTGNHDIQSDRLDTLHKQPLGVLYESGAAQELDGWHPTLPLFGVPWQQRWLHDGVPEQAFADWRMVAEATADDAGERALSQSLAVTHAPIYPYSMQGDVKFELVDNEELAAAMAGQGYLYYGHIHDPHGFYIVNGVTFGNVGAISRGSIHEYNLTRKIQVALWTPEHGFTAIDVPHRPASEIFRIAEHQEKKEAQVSLDIFLSDVGSATLEISSTGSIIKHVQNMDIEKPVKEKAIELLEGAE